MARGTGGVFQRGKTWYIHYSVNGIQHKESTKTHESPSGTCRNPLSRDLQQKAARHRCGCRQMFRPNYPKFYPNRVYRNCWFRGVFLSAFPGGFGLAGGSALLGGSSFSRRSSSRTSSSTVALLGGAFRPTAL